MLLFWALCPQIHFPLAVCLFRLRFPETQLLVSVHDWSGLCPPFFMPFVQTVKTKDGDTLLQPEPPNGRSLDTEERPCRMSGSQGTRPPLQGWSSQQAGPGALLLTRPARLWGSASTAPSWGAAPHLIFAFGCPVLDPLSPCHSWGFLVFPPPSGGPVGPGCCSSGQTSCLCQALGASQTQAKGKSDNLNMSSRTRAVLCPRQLRLWPLRTR